MLSGLEASLFLCYCSYIDICLMVVRLSLSLLHQEKPHPNRMRFFSYDCPSGKL